VTLSEAQAYVRVETGEEEALLAGLIRTATDLCEAFLGQVVLSRSFEVDVAANGRWERLDVAPVQSIDGVVDTAQQALPTSAYSMDIDARGDGWVRVFDTNLRRVRVSGVAGMAQDQNGVPEAIRQGILRLVAHLFTARDDQGGEPPAAVTALWRPYRRTRLS
jgi:uncharacterized phiE125 gp8 family phage protein